MGGLANQEAGTAGIGPMREDEALELARTHAVHCLEFPAIGQPASKEEIGACRKALVTVFADFGEEVVEILVDRLQERGALPAVVEHAWCMADGPAPIERREAAAERILAPMCEGQPVTTELLSRMEHAAAVAMVGFAGERIAALEERVAKEPPKVDDDRIAHSAKGVLAEWLLVDAREGLPSAKDLEALVEHAWGGHTKAITLITREGEDADQAAGYRAVLSVRTTGCRYYALGAGELAASSPEKLAEIAAVVRSGKAAVIGRADDPAGRLLSFLEGPAPALEAPTSRPESRGRDRLVR